MFRPVCTSAESGLPIVSLVRLVKLRGQRFRVTDGPVCRFVASGC